MLCQHKSADVLDLFWQRQEEREDTNCTLSIIDIGQAKNTNLNNFNM